MIAAGAPTPAPQLLLFELPPVAVLVPAEEVSHRPARPRPRVDAAPAPCSLCGYPRTFRRGVCRTCHRKLSDGGLEQLPDLRSAPGLLWLSRRDYLMAWRATLPPTVDRLLVEVFAAPIARPADALSLIATTPAPLDAPTEAP